MISRTEELLLLTVWKLQDDAYTLTVQEAMSSVTGKKVSVGAVYIPLERLAKKGFLETREASPTRKRGGRRKRYYSLSGKGQQALKNLYLLQEKVWNEWKIAEGLLA